MSMLKQDYKEGEMTLSAALALAVKVLNKTMDVSKLSAEKGVCVCARIKEWNGKCIDTLGQLTEMPENSLCIAVAVELTEPRRAAL